jgi:tetratricopeptide (TPR) repeat protein
MNKLFINDTISLATKFCGQEYVEKVTLLRNERERILHNIWRSDVFPEKFEPYRKETFYRDIDFDTAIHYARRCLDETKYLKFLYNVAESAINYGELNRAEVLLKQITDHFEKFADRELLSEAHFKLGNVTFLKNDFKTADAEFTKSLQYYKDVQNPRALAMVTNAHGVLKVNLNQMEQGISLFNEAIKLAQQVHDEETLANAYMNLGNANHVKGNLDKAMSYYQEALKLFGIKDHKVNLAYIYLNLAISYKSKNDLVQAKSNLQKTFELIKETNNKYQKGLAYLLDAEIHYIDEDLSSATAYVTSAFSIFSEIGDRLSVAEAYKIMGMINRKNHEYEVALSFFENSRRINEELGYFLNLGETLVEMGLLYEDTGDLTNAMKAMNSASDYFKKIEADERIRTVIKHIDRLSGKK